MAILTKQNILCYSPFQYTSVVIWFVHANDDGPVLDDVLNFKGANVFDHNLKMLFFYYLYHYQI